MKKNVLAEVEVKVSLQTSFGFSKEDRDGIIWEVMGPRSGIFKLESSEQLTPLEALNKYRARATVEHLIHSFKRITGLKPLRVWKEDTIRGSMMLALLSETAIAIARYEMKDRIERRTVDFKMKEYPVKLSTESILWSLGHLTVTRIISDGVGKATYFSNWDAVSMEIFDNIRRDCGGNPAVSA